MTSDDVFIFTEIHLDRRHGIASFGQKLYYDVNRTYKVDDITRNNANICNDLDVSVDLVSSRVT